MTSNASTARASDAVHDAVRSGVRDLSSVWWWFLGLGVVWTLFGAYVLSYRVGSLAAVAALVGVAFLFGGVTQLAVAARVQSWRWLFVVAGILAVAAGILTFVWPDITLYVVAILVAWYLIVFGILHLVGALEGLIDAVNDLGHAVGRIKALIRIHTAGEVIVRGNLPAAEVNGFEPGLDHLHGLIPSERPQRVHVRPAVEQLPELARHLVGNGVLDFDCAA